MTDTISIDFGTTRTKMAYYDPNKGSAELARLGYNDNPFIPSLFYLSIDNKPLYGDEAAEHLDSDPLGILQDPLKRKLREATVRAGNRAISTPTDLLTIMFSGLRSKTSELSCFRQNPPNAIRLTVPVQYGPPDRRILTEAAQRAGFQQDSITLIDEPVAAAQAWLAEQGGSDEHIVVLDCGGGTLDWACLHRGTGGKFEAIPELPASGDNRIGGIDIDEALISLLEDKITDESSRRLLQSNHCTYLELIRKVKEGYSKTGRGNKVKVGNQNVEITADLLDDVIASRYIDQTCQQLLPYLEKVRDRLKLAKPTVLLVGGSARLRGLKEAIMKQCKCNVIWWERSEFATVLGAIQPDGKKPQTSKALTSAPKRKTIDAKAQAFIHEKQKLHEDIRYFMQEACLIAWRLSSSVNQSANNFSDIISTISDGDESQTISLKIKQAIEAISIEDFDTIITLASTNLVESSFSYIEDLPSAYIKLFPDLKVFKDRFIISKKLRDSIVNATKKDLRILEKEYEIITDYYRQLTDFYPRYDSIMNRSSWLDWLIGGVAGFFTGGLGVAAAVIWSGWRGMNDEQFLKNYNAAILEFINECVKFGDHGERILGKHIQKMNDIWIESFKPLAELYILLAEKGQDLETIELQARDIIRTSEDMRDPDTSLYAAAIISNLKEQRAVPKKSITNVINDLRSNGILITESGELDEKAVKLLSARSKNTASRPRRRQSKQLKR